MRKLKRGLFFRRSKLKARSSRDQCGLWAGTWVSTQDPSSFAPDRKRSVLKIDFAMHLSINNRLIMNCNIMQEF